MPMILTVLVAAILLAIVLWAVQTYVPLEPRIKGLICLLFVLLFVAWVASALGVLPGWHTR